MWRWRGVVARAGRSLWMRVLRSTGFTVVALFLALGIGDTRSFS
jgi:hypothetical protein